MHKPTILIVDDESSSIEIIANILEDSYKLKVAQNGNVALEIVENSKIDLILLDVNMPGLDGFEVASILQNSEKTKDIPYIFLTANRNSDSIVRGFRAKAVDYISKPFNSEELKVRVKNHVDATILKRELQEHNKFIQTILDTQANLVLISTKQKASFANKSLLDFFKCKDINEFNEKYESLSNTFIKNEFYYHTKNEDKEFKWIDEILSLDSERRIVSIVCQSSFEVKAFKINIVKYDENTFIITLTDISKTILKQLRLEDKTIHDKLTDAYNREYFDLNFKSLYEDAKNSDKKLAISLLDIDYFKKVNDNFGHDVGDDVLINFVKAIKKNLHLDDKLVRWGGEEFLLISYVNNKEELFGVLENYRKAIETKEFDEVGNITCSIGSSVYIDKESIENTIKRADEQLYEAKANGRNQVQIN